MNDYENVDRKIKKGSQHLDMVEAFLAQFPLSPDVSEPTRVTVEQFDLWAAKNGYYVLDVDRDTINATRNQTRYRLNNGACSEAWVAQGGAPFNVAVRNFGKDYTVVPAVTALDIRMEKLPEQIKQAVTTKYKAVQALANSVDFDILPLHLQVRLGMTQTAMRRLHLQIERAVSDVNAEFNDLQRQIKRLNPPSTNGGIKAILAVPPDDYED